MSDAMKKFRAAAKRVEKMIATLAEGGDDWRDQNNAIFKARDGLYKRLNQAEIQDDKAGCDEAWETIRELNRKREEAEETGYQARSKRRAEQIAALEAEIREASWRRAS